MLNAEIAADLLDALIVTRATLRLLQLNEVGDDEVNEALDLAEEAIAKATQEQHKG